MTQRTCIKKLFYDKLWSAILVFIIITQETKCFKLRDGFSTVGIMGYCD